MKCTKFMLLHKRGFNGAFDALQLILYVKITRKPYGSGCSEILVPEPD